MEEKKMQELNLDEMDKVSGGAGNYQSCKFYELDAHAQYCIRNGYCPNCGPKTTIEKGLSYYYCGHCRLWVQRS